MVGVCSPFSIKIVRESITQITDNSANLAAEYSYDAWGRMRNPANWNVYSTTAQPTLLFGRGYTGHEQLNQFGIINMNARLYDPLLARFLAPDPFVNSGMTNDFNRYIYARNNPMMYTDPSGQSWKSFWKDVWSSFKRDFKRTFLSADGFEIGYNSNGGGFVNATRGGQVYGPSIGYNNHQVTMGNVQNGIHNMSPISYSSTLEQSVSQAEQIARGEYYNLKSMTSNYQTTISNWIDNHIFMESEIRVDKGYQAAAGVTIAGFKVGFDIQKDTYPLFQSSFDYNRDFLGSVYSNGPTDYGILKEPIRNSWSFGGILGASKSYDYNSSFFSWGQMRSENINLGVVNVTKLFNGSTGQCDERQFSLDLGFDLSLLYGIHGKFRFGYKY